MTKVEKGKSQRWYDTHCAICGKTFTPKEDRANGHCVFKNGDELDFYACLICAKTADISTAVQQTKELGKYDAHTTDIQPEDPKMPPGRSETDPERNLKKLVETGEIQNPLWNSIHSYGLAYHPYRHLCMGKCPCCRDRSKDQHFQRKKRKQDFRQLMSMELD